MSSFRPVGAATPLVEATAGVAAAAVLGTASAVRRARIFHPDGIAHRATFHVAPGGHGAPLLDREAEHRAVVRLSRGVGLPGSVPDVLGLAVRIEDAHGPGAHQDLLLVTSGSGPVSRHALVPARRFDHPQWSTLLPYRLGGRTVLFGARPLDVPAGADRLEDLDAESMRFGVDVAPIRAPWERVGVLHLGERLSDAEAEALRFDPSNSGGGIEPAGVVQAIRRLAYRASQRARPT